MSPGTNYDEIPAIRPADSYESTGTSGSSNSKSKSPAKKVKKGATKLLAKILSKVSDEGKHKRIENPQGADSKGRGTLSKQKSKTGKSMKNVKESSSEKPKVGVSKEYLPAKVKSVPAATLDYSKETSIALSNDAAVYTPLSHALEGSEIQMKGDSTRSMSTVGTTEMTEEGKKGTDDVKITKQNDVVTLKEGSAGKATLIVEHKVDSYNDDDDENDTEGRNKDLPETIDVTLTSIPYAVPFQSWATLAVQMMILAAAIFYVVAPGLTVSWEDPEIKSSGAETMAEQAYDRVYSMVYGESDDNGVVESTVGQFFSVEFGVHGGTSEQ